MKEELDALSKNYTWDLVTLPPGKSVVGCKWIYKNKTRSDGSIERYKNWVRRTWTAKVNTRKKSTVNSEMTSAI